MLDRCNIHLRKKMINKGNLISSSNDYHLCYERNILRTLYYNRNLQCKQSIWENSFFRKLICRDDSSFQVISYLAYVQWRKNRNQAIKKTFVNNFYITKYNLYVQKFYFIHCVSNECFRYTYTRNSLYLVSLIKVTKARLFNRSFSKTSTNKLK